MPSQRQRRARSVVNGIAALEPAPHRKRLRVKNTENVTLWKANKIQQVCVCVCVCVCVVTTTRGWNVLYLHTYPGTKNAVANTFDFHFNPPITVAQTHT